MTISKITTVKSYLLQLQNQICAAVENEDGRGIFHEDCWQYADKGDGRTRVLAKGDVFESVGVNFSHIHGTNLPPAASKKNPQLLGCAFEAMGVSVVIHPANPYVPTTHANLRFFRALTPQDEEQWWFGGGCDLTPYYGFIEDCRHWHGALKTACDPFGLQVYPQFKRACDDYFYLKHRQEARGIGGVFFDDLCEWGFDRCFTFLTSIGDSFWPAYQPIVMRRKHESFGQREREFQCYRRGRYVEFNLVYDRGTLFGLQFGGRIESILMSLPPQVNWRYNWQPEPNTKEAALYTDFLPARDWT